MIYYVDYINEIWTSPLEYYYHEESIKTKYELEALESINESIDKDEGFGNKLRPVFIILLYSDSTFDHIAEKVVKGRQYWHAAIGFGPSLKRTYSFNFGEANANKFKGGLSFESLNFYQKEHPTGTMEVNCVLLDKYRYDKLKETLDYYIKNKEKTKYDFINLARALFGKTTKDGVKMNLVCSTFVDTILKSVNIDLNRKSTNLVKPDDLRANRSNGKQFKVYSGKITKYNVDKATDLVDKLTQDENNKYENSNKEK